MARADIGRIGENIVANELIARGFLVTHLDKGTRGVSANADLMVGHGGLSKPVLIQVKACYDPPLKSVFFGAYTVAPGSPGLFNTKKGFEADYLALASIKDPKSYRVFVVPVAETEGLLVSAYEKFHSKPTRAGAQRKKVPTMYLNLTLQRREGGNSEHGSVDIFSSLASFVRRHENAFGLLVGSGAPDDIPLVMAEATGKRSSATRS